MKYTITKFTKRDDWVKADLMDENGQEYQEVSINKEGKDGKEFPGFDTLKVTATVAGNLWQSAKGTYYLFPPKEEKRNNKSSGITAAQNLKAQHIALAQGAKERGIMLASIFNGAKDILIQEMATATALGEEPVDWVTRLPEIRAELKKQWESELYDKSEFE